MRSPIAITLLAVSLAVPAVGVEVDLVYIGPADSPALQGLRLGIEESNRQGEFLGVKLTLSQAPSSSLPPSAIAVFADSPGSIRSIAQETGPQAVLNLSDTSDALRAACLPNALHVIPSSKMKADAVVQWVLRNPADKPSAAAWHSDAVKFAARDLNKRFLAKFATPMDDLAWAGWFAARAVGDSLMREPARPMPSRSAGSCSGRLTAWMAKRVIPHSFRSQRPAAAAACVFVGQPTGELLGEAPVRGVSNGRAGQPGKPSPCQVTPCSEFTSLLSYSCQLLRKRLAEPTHRLFVTNEAGDSVTVIDTRSGAVEATIAGRGAVRAGSVSAPTASWSTLPSAMTTLSACSTPPAARSWNAPFPAGSDPEAFAVHPDGTIYLSNEDDGLATAPEPGIGRDPRRDQGRAWSPRAWASARTANRCW